ncbi:MAG: hypothetical protein QM725_13825 [Lacibacter sp.]
MQRTVVALAITIVVLASYGCKKSGNKTPGISETYQPVSSGSEWNYTTTGSNAGSFKITATSSDTLINARSYRILTNSGGANMYYCKSGSDYYRYGRFAELNNEPLELLYLKDIAVGQSWTETKIVSATVSGMGTVPVTAKFTFTVAEKGTAHIVGSTTFNEVIKITAIPSFNVSGSPIPVASSTFEYYYAKNIGLIHSITALNIPLASINSSSVTVLGSYSIK